MNFIIEKINCVNTEASNFIKRNHYLKSVARGCRYVFLLKDDDKIIGVAQFGEPVGTYVKTKWGNDVIELKRFVLAPGCPKNTGSWFMARCMKQLNNGAVISYSDPEQGHDGTLYRAANFIHVGQQPYPTQYVWHKGKKYSTRIMYNKNLSKLGMMLRKAHKRGDAVIKLSQKKDVFMYEVR